MTQRSGQEKAKQHNHFSAVVHSLELCWGCDRICSCEEWLANESVPVWLCQECLAEFAFRMERQGGVTLSLPPAIRS